MGVSKPFPFAHIQPPPERSMKRWIVERNSGSRAHLVAGMERIEVWRPQAMSRHDFLRLLAQGADVCDSYLQAVFEYLQ